MRFIYYFLFITALFTHIIFSFISWGSPIIEKHGFRQTQTAISAYWLKKENFFRFDYPTPVLGYPWSIPLEFPLFQSIVAVTSSLFSTPLDTTGRGISLLFFYGCLIVLWNIGKTLKIPAEATLMVLSLILVSPVYLFWSRSFMIESFALFLTLLYLYFCITNEKKFTAKFQLGMLVFGMLAIAVKITTFTVVFLPCLLYFIFNSFKEYHYFKKRLLPFFLGYLLPALTGWGWIKYTDYVRQQNPLGSDVFPTNKLMWMFGGTWEKLHPAFRIAIGENIQNFVIGSVLFIPAIIILNLFFKKYSKFSFICLLFFAMGPVIFTNLYAAHDYYFYANALFLYSALGFTLSSIIDSAKNKKLRLILSCTLLPAVIVFLFGIYLKSYYPLQIKVDSSIKEAGRIINHATRENDIILVYGYYLDPRLPYYAERKAIMDEYDRPLDNSQIANSLTLTGKYDIGGLLALNKAPDFVTTRIKYFGLSEKPVFSNVWGTFYAK